MSKRERLLDAIAEILEIPVTADTPLDSTTNWDSLCSVMVIAALDDVFGIRVNGEQLFRCAKVADILALAGES